MDWRPKGVSPRWASTEVSREYGELRDLVRRGLGSSIARYRYTSVYLPFKEIPTEGLEEFDAFIHDNCIYLLSGRSWLSFFELDSVEQLKTVQPKKLGILSYLASSLMTTTGIMTDEFSELILKNLKNLMEGMRLEELLSFESITRALQKGSWKVLDVHAWEYRDESLF
jgi:hypothetical protein